MSKYNEIATAAGPGPAYPSRGNFTSYFGYSAGKALGSFESKEAATGAGATIFEQHVDEDAYQAARAAYSDFNMNIHNEWFAAMRAEYPEFNDNTFALIYSKAYEVGHSYGMGEVEIYISDFAEFASSIISNCVSVAVS